MNGYVLVIVLIFLLLTTVLGMQSLQSSILLQKMNQSYYHEMQNQVYGEKGKTYVLIKK